MAGHRPSSRKKILAAAADLARQAGPVRFSLDAVASHAGVSKGGLLYNFPTKAKLMQGLVEDYLDEFEAALDAATGPGKDESLLAAYIRLSAKDCESAQPAAAWIFAAMAEDPDFLEPIHAFRDRLLDRLRAEATDPTAMLVTFLAVEGLRNMKLFGSRILATGEREAVVASLLSTASEVSRPREMAEAYSSGSVVKSNG
ncbi:MAG: TetR/AcrR family transcriptional regulator [Bauldia sp.]|nr:TetR/AcrR family transcriptional regulator [Bauldia sp.]